MMKWKEKAGMTLDFSLYQGYLIKTSKNVSRLLFVPKESPTGKIAFRDTLIVFYCGGIHV